MADISQELLLAALALLTSAVPRDAVRSALMKWAENPALELGELLKEGGWLDGARWRPAMPGFGPSAADTMATCGASH